MDFFAPDRIISPERGDLLISEPYLPDPNFERTVILLCEHDENGSFGFVLNKKAANKLPELIDEAGSFDAEVFIGGPVQQNTLHFLHRNGSLLNRTKMIIDGVYWGVDFDGLLQKMNLGVLQKEDLKFFVGYSGWSPGQLEEELQSKSWIVFKNPTQDLIFDCAPAQLWKEVLARMGGKYKVMANYPMDPRLN